MGRRRRRPDGSSLDLFLDTICNTFGCILFISLLVSLAAQQKGAELESEEIPPVEQSEIDAESRKIEELAQIIKEARTKAELLEKQQPTPEEVEMAKLQERVSQAQKNLDEAIERQIEESRKLASIETEIANARRDAEKVEQSLKEAQAAMSAKSAGFANNLNSATEKVPIPNEKETSKANFLIAMRYQKVYLVSDLSSQNAGDLDDRYVKEVGGLVCPIESSGWRVDKPSDMEKFQKAIQARPPSQYFMSVGVWADSYDEFKQLRELVVPKGYQYELILIGDVEGIPVRKGSHPKIQ